MWKSMVVAVLAIPLSAVMLVAFWAARNWRTGLIAGCVTFAICLVVATLMIFTVKKLSLFDVFLPLLFSVVWSAILIPFSLGAEVFTAPSAIGAGFILTFCLWKVYHNRELSKNWLIFPIIVFLYEMLPINIPGPFDDYFCFGGDVVSAILMTASTSLPKQLPTSWERKTDEQKLIPGDYKDNR
jgi:hypothetical protein